MTHANLAFAAPAEGGRPGSMVQTLDSGAIGALATRLAVEEPTLLHLAQIPQRTYQRRKAANTPLTPTESDRLLRVQRLAQEAERVFGQADKARGWLARPCPALGGAKPLELLGTDAGAHAVQLELTRIEWGDFA